MRYNVLLDCAQIRCRPNKLEVSSIYKYLIKNGHKVVKASSEADFIIVNTCGFDEIHERTSIALFKHYQKNKRKGAKVISLGCLNKINRVLLKREIPGIQLIDSLEELDSLFYVKERFQSNRKAYLTADAIEELALAHHLRVYYNLLELFYLKVLKKVLKNSQIKRLFEAYMDEDKFFVEIGRGCTFHCSYCIIKKARDRLKSRSIGEIIDDVAAAYEEDKTLVLVADDCGSYGLDIGTNLPELLHEINNNFPNINIELIYLNPYWLKRYKATYLEVFEKINLALVNVPMQSGSTRIVRKMNRPYNVDEITGILQEIREISPDTAFWSHILVGFPGENLQDFMKTLLLLRYVGYLHCFRYSDREGTKSTDMTDKNPQWLIDFKYLIVLILTQIEGAFRIVKYIFKRLSNRT